MAFPKSAPRVKGPYSERGGSRFRVRICDGNGQRDIYFSSLQEARNGMKEAARELPQTQEYHSLRRVLDEFTQEKVRRGLCKLESAEHQRDCLCALLADFLDQDIAKGSSIA